MIRSLVVSLPVRPLGEYEGMPDPPHQQSAVRPGELLSPQYQVYYSEKQSCTDEEKGSPHDQDQQGQHCLPE